MSRRGGGTTWTMLMALILTGMVCLTVYFTRVESGSASGDQDCGREGKLACRVDAEEHGAKPTKFRRWRNNQTVSVTEVMGGGFFRLERHTVNIGKTNQVDDWMWVEVPDMVNCLVQDDKGDFLMFRQNKYGFKGESLAPVGGYLEAGEKGVDGCKREVLEEIGFECPKYIPLGVYRTDTNRGFGWYHAFHAKHCRQSAKKKESDDWEQQNLVRLTRAELARELLSGGTKEVKWAATFALALLRESSEFGNGDGAKAKL